MCLNCVYDLSDTGPYSWRNIDEEEFLGYIEEPTPEENAGEFLII